jgi:hypothetical protein
VPPDGATKALKESRGIQESSCDAATVIAFAASAPPADAPPLTRPCGGLRATSSGKDGTLPSRVHLHVRAFPALSSRDERRIQCTW